jgi:uncharacterized protein YceH (UPF0502 family)
MHYINSESVSALILDTIRQVSTYARTNEAAFVEKLREASHIRQADTAKAHAKRIAKNQKRIAELETETAALQAELSSFEAENANTGRFLELVQRYTDFTKLTAPMLHEFVEQVVVHEADRSSGKREQRVDIYLNFIGCFAVPREEETASEQLAADEEKRAAWREYKRRQGAHHCPDAGAKHRLR